MEHERKWCTCDRCGAEIKKGILCGNSVTKNGILIPHTTCAINAWKILKDLWKMKNNKL